jgi:hypothetical protein
MKFTAKLKTNGLLPYLDVVVTTKLGGSLQKTYTCGSTFMGEKKTPSHLKNVVLIPIDKARVCDMEGLDDI